MKFDVNKFADGIGQILGEAGKGQSVDLGRKIRASLDVAVTELNETTKHAMQQVRTAKDRLEGYTDDLRGIVSEVKSEFERAKVDGVEKLQEERIKVKDFMAGAKAEVVSEANKRLSELESGIDRIENRLKSSADNVTKELEDRLESRKAQLEELMKGLSIERVGEFVDKYMDDDRLDALADRMMTRFMKAFGRWLQRVFLRKKDKNGTNRTA